MTTPIYFFNAFGVSGDLTPVPIPAQGSGSISYYSGWGPFYQGDLLTDPTALSINRSQTNQLFFDVTSNIQAYQQIGIPYFITTSANQGTPFSYSKWSWAFYDASDGHGLQPYQSITASNVSLPTVTSAWRLMTNIVNSDMLQQNYPTYGTDTGTTNTLVVTNSIPYRSVAAGTEIKVNVAHANTGASTLNIDGLGAIAIRKNAPLGLIPLSGGEMVANVYTFFNNGTYWILKDPSIPSSCGATIYPISSQTVGSSATVQITLDTTTLQADESGTVTYQGSPNYLLTANVTGRYAISATIEATVPSAVTVGNIVLVLNKNNSSFQKMYQLLVDTTGSEEASLIGYTEIQLNAGDYIQFECNNTTSVTATLSKSGTFSMRFLGK